MALMGESMVNYCEIIGLKKKLTYFQFGGVKEAVRKPSANWVFKEHKIFVYTVLEH